MASLTTKTLVIAGESGFATNDRSVVARCFAPTIRPPARKSGEVYMPAPQSGSPMTYRLDGKQYIVVAISGGNIRASLWRSSCRN